MIINNSNNSNYNTIGEFGQTLHWKNFAPTSIPYAFAVHLRTLDAPALEHVPASFHWS